MSKNRQFNEDIYFNNEVKSYTKDIQLKRLKMLDKYKFPTTNIKLIDKNDPFFKEVGKVKFYYPHEILAMTYNPPIIDVGIGAMIGLDVHREAIKERNKIRNSIAEIRENTEKTNNNKPKI